MPELARPRSWRWMGRLLPRSLRDLMYEPLCDDLWRAHVTRSSGGGRLRLWLRFFGGFAASVGFSFPRYFVERNRITAFGKAALVLATGVTVAGIVLLTPWIVLLATHR